MQRLSPDSLLKSVGASSESLSSALTPQAGSTQGGGLTSETPEARAWLEARTPAQVDAELKASLTSSLGVTLKTTREWRFPEGKPAYSLTTTTGATAPSRENIDRAIRRVDAAMTPVSRRTAETMIGQLTAATATRSQTEAVNEVKLDLFVDCLLRHPADVATAAIRHLAIEPREGGGTAWFPTLPELEGICRQLAGDRLSMLQGLRSWSPPEPVDEKRVALRRAWDAAEHAAKDAKRRTGPGPTVDTGPRGERLEQERIAIEAAAAARKAYEDYKPE